MLCEKPDQLNSWMIHFSQLYGSEVQFDDSALDFIDQIPVLNHLNIYSDILEVMSALKGLKSGKAPGSDGIP